MTVVAAVDIAALLRGEDGARREPVELTLVPPPPCPGHFRRGDFCADPACPDVPTPTPDTTGAPLIDAADTLGTWAGFRSPWAGDDALTVAGLAIEEVIDAATVRGATSNQTALAAVTALEAAGLVLVKAEEVSP